MFNAAIIIPFRDRGHDPLRAANLLRVLEHWKGCKIPVSVVDDGRHGDELFNRSAAYNRGANETCADVLIYVEADILVDYRQINEAVTLAAAAPGLVLPFTRLHALNDADSQLVRASRKDPADCPADSVSDQSVGPANVVSRATLDMVGCWDEAFRGHGFDDLAMHTAFEIVAGPVRRVPGPAYHLFHLLGDPGPRNFDRAQLYGPWSSPDEIRELTSGKYTTGWPDWTEAAYV